MNALAVAFCCVAHAVAVQFDGDFQTLFLFVGVIIRVVEKIYTWWAMFQGTREGREETSAFVGFTGILIGSVEIVPFILERNGYLHLFFWANLIYALFFFSLAFYMYRRH